MSTERNRIGIAIALTMALGASAPAGAAVFTVDSTVDAPDASPGDGICASAANECTLRAAIQEANALAGADEIVLPAGTFVATDLPAVTDELTIGGAGATESVVEGSGIVADLPLTGLLTLRDLTISGSPGVGVLVVQGRLHLQRADLVGNATGVRIECCDALIEESSILANGSSGVVVEGMLRAVIERTVVAHNQGNGIELLPIQTRLELYDSVVAENMGAGIQSGEGDGIVERSVIRDNTGSGYRSSGDSGFRIVDSVFSGNGAGGIVCDAPYDFLILERSSVIGNHSSHTGGIRCGFDSGSLRIRNSTISGNVGGTIGGVLSASARIENSTITGNVGGATGGLQIAAEYYPLAFGSTFLRLDSTLIAGNSGDEAPDCASIEPQDSPFSIAGNANLIGDATGCDFAADVGAIAGDATSPIDPLLGPLADNGGPTPTHALLPGSPAIDTGACPLTSPTDQRGVPRWLDGTGDGLGACDIGAYEVTPCADGIDNDGDGLVDMDDPGCRDPLSVTEHPQCQNGIDDDGDGRIDFDGGASWNGGVPIAEPDPACIGRPWASENTAAVCGLGGELMLAVGALAWWRRRAFAERARNLSSGRARQAG